MIKNRYLNTQDHRRGMRDGRGDMGEHHERFSRYNQYLERNNDMPYSQDKEMDYRRNMRDYAYDRAYDMGYDRYDGRSDYNYDRHSGKMSEEMYHEDLERWCEKLKKKDRFKINKEELLRQAKQMGIKFEEYSEEEFYVIYLMHIADYKNVANDHRMYLSMAKDWLEDDDIEASPSEKIYIYFYYIVKGKEIK